MIKRSCILFVDMLYSDAGSLDEDMKLITQSVGLDYEIKYLRFRQESGKTAILTLFKEVFINKYEKIIFLSSKVSQLMIFLPLTFKLKCYAIYHFLPNHRKKLHKYFLLILTRFFVFGVYASGVANQIEKSLGYKPLVLPSRIVNRYQSLKLLREKLAQDNISLLVPGVRTGVRNPVKIIPIFNFLKTKFSYTIESIFVQGEMSVEHEIEKKVKKLGKLPQSTYDQLYYSSAIVVMDFYKQYEVRASGMILDALRSGCIVVTEDHPIVRQYGFPNTVVTDLLNLEKVISAVNNLNDEQAIKLIPGVDFKDFSNKWRAFLK